MTENNEKKSDSTEKKKDTRSTNQFLFALIYITPVICVYGWFLNEAIRMGGAEEFKILHIIGLCGAIGSIYLITKLFLAAKAKKQFLDARTSFEALIIFIFLLIVLYGFKDFVPSQMFESYVASDAEIKKEFVKEDKAESIKKPSTLQERIYITAPLMNHEPVKQESIEAINEAVKCLPEKIRKTLDQFGASISLSPNLIDKWPDAVDTLPEDSPAPNFAELPGRIYGSDMNIYERKKLRGTTKLSKPRKPSELKHTALNMCVQVYDDATGFTKSEALRSVYNEDKKNVSGKDRVKLATFLKNDDWGPRETCAETGASLLGGGNEYTKDLYRCFPKTRAWLEKNLYISTK